MATRVSFEIPLESLTQGVHTYTYALDDSFFESHEGGLLSGGTFAVTLELERVRSQFNVALEVEGHAKVTCDRCLDPFAFPISATESMVIKYDNERPREEEDVIYVPYGAESYNVAKLLYDTIGLALPMSTRHEDAGLDCNPSMLTYLDGGTSSENEPQADNNDEIPVDSPWRALNALKQKPENS